ncbi:acyl-CoA carboxylase subunit epsilon [Actinacidiphila glaucinigra]|uniref:acyl-CoA carboxylase subunit epsilon n=1 Tax=Actinacidiphila glaucinigra TaxID=235986 RepID=UPI002DD9AECB|nr:acyl-CoA carboxylase subunit epsilon [Actinacidiphila glaucinigra]WSD60446.1 acyl-CoA carboxylase subunit epsilon [Actinacidiphila glaucinigra]
MVIKVERGNPTPEELAAVVALVQARAAAAAGPVDGPRAADEWASPARNVPGRMPRPAPASWRSTYWPH